MAFRIRQDVYENQTRRAILNNSLTVKVGDLVIPLGSSSAVTNDTSAIAGDKYPIGVVVGFSKSNGEVIGNGTDPLNTPAQLVTASDNLTVAKYYAVYVPLYVNLEFSADMDAAGGTTAGSDTSFVWFDLVDCRTIDESSVVVYTSGTAPLQILSFGLDPNDLTNKSVICRVAKSGETRP